MNVRNFADFKSFLLDNKTVKQTIFKNTFWLAVAEGISRLLKLVLLIYVARILGATEYGKFTFALAFVSLFAIFSDFGLSSIITREFSREKEKEKEFSPVFSLKILLSIGALILILIGSFFVTPDPVIQKVIWILAIYIIVSGFSEIIYAFLRARQRMEYEAWAKILQAVVVTGAGFFIILSFPSVQNLSYSYLFASLAALIFILIFFHFKVYHLHINWNKLIWKRFLLMSWPLALVTISYTIYTNTDSVMMGYWGQMTQTGWYNAAYKIIGVTLVPVGIILQSFFPVLSKAFKESKEQLQKVWNYQMGIMTLIGVPLVAGGIALAPRIIDLVYGLNFSPSIFAFQILIIMSGIAFLHAPFNQALVVSDQQKKLFWATISTAMVNIILNLILIPRYSLYGAATATVITYFLIFLLLFKFTSKYTSINPLNLKVLFVFIGAIFSSTIMYFAVSQTKIYYLNIFLSILIGIVIYLVCLFAYRKLAYQIFIHLK